MIQRFLLIALHILHQFLPLEFSLINCSTWIRNFYLPLQILFMKTKTKNNFIEKMADRITESKTSNTMKQKATKYKSYILNHWKVNYLTLLNLNLIFKLCLPISLFLLTLNI